MRRLIKTDGTILDLPPKAAGNMRAILKLIGADTADTVALRHLGEPMQIMVVDDTGLIKRKPVNAKATELYLANCRPGTTASIHGDVVITLDSDFGQEL